MFVILDKERTFCRRVASSSIREVRAIAKARERVRWGRQEDKRLSNTRWTEMRKEVSQQKSSLRFTQKRGREREREKEGKVLLRVSTRRRRKEKELVV